MYDDPSFIRVLAEGTQKMEAAIDMIREGLPKTAYDVSGNALVG